MSDSPDVLQELDAWIALYPHANIAQRARDEIVALRAGLGELIKLQSHYAGLLNDYDGGKRIQFTSAEDWLRRLHTLKAKRERR